MKQLMVLMATIILGAAISTVVLGFQDNAESMGKAADNVLSAIETTTSEAAVELTKSK